MKFCWFTWLMPGISPEDCHDNQSSIHQSDDDFEIGDLPVKLELRYAIEAKRAEKGLDMPIIEEIPKLPRELTLEEEERRRIRRERNKVAASRCRVKRKHHVRKLIKESDELTRMNNSLEEMIGKLQVEKDKLEEAIRTHHCKSLHKFNEEQDR